METLIHTAFGCGGEVVAHYETYGRGLPCVEFICEGCGHIIGGVSDVVRFEAYPLDDATAENVEYAGEVQ